MGATANIVYGVLLSKKSIEKIEKIITDEEVWDSEWPEGTIENDITGYKNVGEISLECSSRYHLSCDWVVVVSHTQIISCEGGIKEVGFLPDFCDYNEAIYSYCKKHGLTAKCKPTWLLVCSEG